VYRRLRRVQSVAVLRPLCRVPARPSMLRRRLVRRPTLRGRFERTPTLYRLATCPAKVGSSNCTTCNRRACNRRACNGPPPSPLCDHPRQSGDVGQVSIRNSTEESFISREGIPRGFTGDAPGVIFGAPPRSIAMPRNPRARRQLNLISPARGSGPSNGNTAMTSTSSKAGDAAHQFERNTKARPPMLATAPLRRILCRWAMPPFKPKEMARRSRRLATARLR
jgi:hypothetical protein